MNNLFGTDPEFFVVNSSGICIPPALLRYNRDLETFGFSDPEDVPEEEKRHPIFYKDEELLIIEDGAAFEFTVTPSKEPHELYYKVARGKEILKELVRPLGLRIFDRPAVEFDPQVLFVNGVLNEYLAWSCRFGCDKDLDIYSGAYSEDIDASQITQRFGGGHFHISPIDHGNYHLVARLFDIFLGSTFISSTQFPEEEKARQRFYGRPGKIRLQTYPTGTTGIEYRPPSNSWLSNFDTVKLMFKSAHSALELMDNTSKANSIIRKYLDRVINNMLTFNREDSKTVLSELNII